MSDSAQGASVDRVQDALAILYRLVSGWLTIGICATVGLLLAIGYLHIATYNYSTRLVLVPTQGQNLGSAGGQLSQLASLAGVDLNRGQSVAPFVLYPDTVVSQEVAADVAANNPRLMQELFFDQWDVANQRWVPPEGLRRTVVNFVKSMLGIPNIPWRRPGGAELQRFLGDKINLDQNLRRPVLTLTMEHEDPAFAARMLLAVHASTDRALRQIVLNRSTKYVAYLEQKLQTVQQADLRQVLMNTLSEQETMVMMSSSGTAFAAQPLGPPEQSIKPVKPVPVLTLLFGIAAGLIFGCMIVFLRGNLMAGIRHRWRMARAG